MALSTKDDNGSEGFLESGLRHIVIKLPEGLQERLLCLPFLHALRDKYPESEFHLICPKNQIEVLNLLPFRAYYHEYSEEEIKTPFDAHRFAVQAKIHQVDLFVNLTNSFADACLGISLRAKLRLGFSDGWKSLLLNRKLKRPTNHHLCEDFLALYQELTGAPADLKLKVLSRELMPVLKDWDNPHYIAINLSPLRQAAIEEEWLRLISNFRNQRIVFFSSEDQDEVQFLIKPFLARLPAQNEYINYVYSSWIELAKLLAYARGTITYEGAAAGLSAYVGTKTLILYDREDPRRTGPFYFMTDVKILQASQKPQDILTPRSQFDMQEVASMAFDFFRLSTGVC
jgi:ADP-heptose:LPS heptosyltransferase